MESVETSQVEQKPRRKRHFFKEGNCWYFLTEAGSTIGPFDRVYQIVLGECFLGELRGEQKEVSGGEIARVLWPLT